MTQADVSGLCKNMVSQRTGRNTVENDAPHIRLDDDADLKEIYTFGRKLGQGSFGVVYEATHIETKTQWAIKEVCRPGAGSSKVKLLEQELKILRQVNHAHIIHLKESYETAKMTYLVTELCVGGELKELLQRKMFFTEDETRHIIHSLADAIVYLHKRDIVHRDLKLENILVKNDLDEDDNGKINIKVTDFGLSVMTGGVGIANMMTDACGTLIYMAPEMMSGRGYSQWCDIWSIGVIMYILLCGEPPFVSKTRATLLEKITKKELKFAQPIWATVSDAAKNVLTCLLKVDPAYRMSANQLLENPWITGDTNMPAIPCNVLEMMRHHLEQEEITRTLGDLSFTSSEDTLDPSLLYSAASTETDSGCKSHAKLSPERDDSSCTPSTSTKPSKEGGGHLQQDKRKNVSETQGPPQPSTTQFHAGLKPSRQPSAKQRRPQDKRDVSTVQKPAPDLSKAGDQRPSTSIKSKTGFRKPPAASKTTTPSERDKKTSQIT
ncbi:serine/threonine-protein kinase 33 [Thunnus albacares]|uniref:serine/threonine-protein kinase 33 n=1 Tax=Thunnus maccoyii TaxID=8240 RepID=UPI001C4B3A78|nr:serine/threonine-protein kinase 33 [Thunnus maccoyii]XP_042273245.1 serine/threonine-protein kinase 33 [Thunnus maccoyii]XP_044206129.1 serine/threonine-protein kinase 33 [Thunnus albacares]XP_044206138.1 serine/threonine-protein kinase 33 [Thunnus albacares]